MAAVARLIPADDQWLDAVAGVSAPFPPLPGGDPALVTRGQGLAKVGSAAKSIPACDNCHVPGGAGEPPAIPYLAGQYGPYIAFELHIWQRGFRKSSPEAMAQIAKRLDDQDIAALAAYYQQMGSGADAVASH